MVSLRRRGITGTLEQALLIALTLAFFVGIVVSPVVNAADMLMDAPSNAWKSWNDFVDWLVNGMDQIFHLDDILGGG